MLLKNFSVNSFELTKKIDGMLILNKPYKFSSNFALQKVKKIYGSAKAGHGGSLDPLAIGVLPIFLGSCTKVSSVLLHSKKKYYVTVHLGAQTHTLDSEGIITEKKSFKKINYSFINKVLAGLQGNKFQVPPIFSAIKKKGLCLYHYARKNISTKECFRLVKIYNLSLISWKKDQLKLYVCCSKGTYIRSLAQDIGRALLCGAYLRFLHRTNIFSLFYCKYISIYLE